MAPHKTVTINGRAYDSVTGLPIESVQVTDEKKKPIKKPAPKPAPKAAPRTEKGKTSSEVVHSTMQRSQTLHRRAAKKPAAPQKPIVKRNSPGRHMDIARSTSVTKFAKHPEVAAPVPRPATAPAAKPDKPARVHPLAERAIQRNNAKKVAAAKAAKPVTSKEVKEAAIAKALDTPKPKLSRKSKNRKTLRRTLIIVGVVVAVLLVIFAVWRLVPNLSVSVAAAQAGVEATYPEYTPDGYSLSQPVTYSDGQVDLKFVSNSNDNYYTVSQTRSSWDSSAVLDKVVTPAAGANYVTTKERGLTIYTYEANAAWVNGGILYQILSKAPLSGDQVRRIATSL